MKSTFIFLFFISLLAACLPGKSGLSTETQTSTFTPTEEPGITVTASQVELSSVLEYDEKFSSLQTGTYFIYYQLCCGVGYMRPDGARHGNILEFLEEPDVVELSNDIENPQLFIAQSSEEQIVLYRINLSERTLNSISISIEAEMLCYDEHFCSFSPDGNWFLGAYRHNNKSVPYLIDLVNMKSVSLNSGSYYCNYYKEYGWGVQWSPDSSWFYLRCFDYSSSSGEDLNCFGSTRSPDLVCKSPVNYYISSISPDGKNVAVHFWEQRSEQNSNEFVLSIIDYSCLKTGETCKDLIQISYQNAISTVWSQSGQYLIWFEYPLLASQGVGYTTIGKVDNWNNEVSIITDSAPKGCSIESLSPDNEWIIFERPNQIVSSYLLVSQTTHTLPFKVFQLPYILGWMEIP